MRVVLKIWSGNPNRDGGCDYAMVDLTPELAALALGRIGTVRQQQATDPELEESYFWDSHAAYFSLWVESGTLPGFGCEAGQSTTLEDLGADQREVVQVPEGFQVRESHLARVECEQMIVRKNGIAFTAIPKHRDFRVSTAEISTEWLETATNTGMNCGSKPAR